MAGVVVGVRGVGVGGVVATIVGRAVGAVVGGPGRGSGSTI